MEKFVPPVWKLRAARLDCKASSSKLVEGKVEKISENSSDHGRNSGLKLNLDTRK
jgi:hypothetical protein